MGRRKRGSDLITLLTLVVLFMLMIGTAVIVYYMWRIHQTVERIPFITLQAGKQYISDTVKLPLQLENGTTVYVDATYNCTLNGDCKYVFMTPTISTINLNPLPILITNTLDDTLINYTIKIEFNSSWIGWNTVSNNGEDIYFTDQQGNPLYYWIEYLNTTEQKAIIYVNVPDIPASSTKTIYMYYGDNPYTSYHDPENTFMFFDDFEDGVLDTDKWVKGTKGCSLAGAEETVYDGRGVLHIWGYPSADTDGASGYVYTSINFTAGFLVHIHHLITEEEYADVSFGYGPVNEIYSKSYHPTFYNGYAFVWNTPVSGNSANDLEIYRDRLTSLVSKDSSSLTTVNEWHDLEYVYDQNGYLRWYHDGELWLSVSDTTYLNSELYVMISQGEDGDGNGGDRYIDYVFIRRYVDPEPSISFRKYMYGNILIGGKNYQVLMNGTTYTISYTPSVQITSSYKNNMVNITVSGAKLIYGTNEYNDTISITPEEAWSNNVVYIISCDPANMYYLSYYVPIVKYDLQVYREQCTLTSCSIEYTYTYEAKNTTDVSPITVYNVSNVKLAPGTNAVKPAVSYNATSHLIYIAGIPEKTYSVSINYDVNIVPRQPITEYRSLTGSIVISSQSDVVLDNLMLKVTITSTDGTVFTNDYSIEDILPGKTQAIIIDYLGIPLPRPGTYKLSLAVWYDPDGQIYYLMEKELDLVVGYKLSIILDREATVTIIGDNGEELKFYGDRIETVVLPGTYKIIVEVDGMRVEREVVIMDNDAMVTINIGSEATATVSNTSSSTSTLKYALIALFMIIILAMVMIFTGKR